MFAWFATLIKYKQITVINTFYPHLHTFASFYSNASCFDFAHITNMFFLWFILPFLGVMSYDALSKVSYSLEWFWLELERVSNVLATINYNIIIKIFVFVRETNTVSIEHVRSIILGSEKNNFQKVIFPLIELCLSIAKYTSDCQSACLTTDCIQTKHRQPTYILFEWVNHCHISILRWISVHTLKTDQVSVRICYEYDLWSQLLTLHWFTESFFRMCRPQQGVVYDILRILIILLVQFQKPNRHLPHDRGCSLHTVASAIPQQWPALRKLNNAT